MGDKKSNGLTAKSGALILLMSILLSAAAFISNLLPYLTHKEFAAPCTSHTTATIIEASDIVLEGNLYYGPYVEYYHVEKDRLVHTIATSAVKSQREWQVGETVNIAYDPNSPGDLYITDDNMALKSYKKSLIMTIIMISTGFIICIIGIIRTIRGTDPELYERRFIKTPDGKSFEEWAEEQKKKIAEDTPENNEDQ